MIVPKAKMVLVTGFILIMFAALALAQEVPRMSKDELKAELGKPDLLILDVRSGHDWDSSQTKIQSAVREDPSKVDGWINKYPKDKKIVLYCA